MKVAVDCDGVLSNFTDGFLKLFNNLYPSKALPAGYEPSDWNYTGFVTPEEMKAVFSSIKASPRFWESLKTYKENFEQFLNFLDYLPLNTDVWIVTSRCDTKDATAARQTKRWLIRNADVPLCDVITVARPEQKTLLYGACGFDFSIDDKGDAVEEYEKIPNHTAVLLDRPWNQDVQVKYRVKDFNAFVDIVRGGVNLEKV